MFHAITININNVLSVFVRSSNDHRGGRGPAAVSVIGFADNTTGLVPLTCLGRMHKDRASIFVQLRKWSLAWAGGINIPVLLARVQACTLAGGSGDRTITIAAYWWALFPPTSK